LQAKYFSIEKYLENKYSIKQHFSIKICFNQKYFVSLPPKKNDMKKETVVKEPAALTYGMSAELAESDLLLKIRDLSRDDKKCLIRYLHQIDDQVDEEMEFLDYNPEPYTIEELNARIDEAEVGIEKGEGKSFEEMMNGFRRELLWLK
jgi:hypothetical protein